MGLVSGEDEGDGDDGAGEGERSMEGGVVWKIDARMF